MADPHGFDLVGRGPSFRLAQRFGFNRPDRPRRVRKILLLILVTWVPLVLLSLVAGHAFGNRVAVTLLRDPVILSRFLFVLPLLALAEIVVERSLGVQSRQFLASGVVPAGETDRFEEAKAEALRLRESVVAEGVILVLAVAIAIIVQVVSGSARKSQPGSGHGRGNHARRLVVHPGEPADPVLLPPPLALDLPALVLVPVPGLAAES